MTKQTQLGLRIVLQIFSRSSCSFVCVLFSLRDFFFFLDLVLSDYVSFLHSVRKLNHEYCQAALCFFTLSPLASHQWLSMKNKHGRLVKTSGEMFGSFSHIYFFPFQDARLCASMILSLRQFRASILLSTACKKGAKVREVL